MRHRTAHLLALAAAGTIVTLAGCKQDPAPAPLATESMQSAAASDDATGGAPSDTPSG